MDIDIFSIKPSVVSRDLSGKSFFIYGQKKTGKTTIATKFPKPILLGFERGWNLISGIIAQPINNWKEALAVKKQLVKQAEETTDTTFKTVIVDTADLAWDYCEAYILTKEGVNYLSETEDKRGYKAVAREYDKFFQDIVKAGYTLVAISHAETKQMKEKGIPYDRTQPTVDKRGLAVLSRLCDITGFATPETDENGKVHTMLYMRGSKELEAGSRNPYTSDKIPFTYEALLEDMTKAIDKQEANGATVVDHNVTNVYADVTKQADFKETLNSIGQIAKTLTKAGLRSDYDKIVAETLGKGKSCSECDETQIDLLEIILDNLKDYIAKNKIEIK